MNRRRFLTFGLAGAAAAAPVAATAHGFVPRGPNTVVDADNLFAWKNSNGESMKSVRFENVLLNDSENDYVLVWRKSK